VRLDVALGEAVLGFADVGRTIIAGLVDADGFPREGVAIDRVEPRHGRYVRKVAA